MALLIAVAIAVTLSACAVPHARHTAAPAGQPLTTAVKTYTPYAATGTITVPVAAIHKSGSCWTGSISVPQAGAYRCLVGNTIADPCFADAPGSAATPATQVLCAADPWTPATVVTLTDALPKLTGSTRATGPWALELANGAHCVAVTGTVPLVGAVALQYTCGSPAGAGRLTTIGSLMSVQYSVTGDGPLQTVSVTTAWRA